MKYKIEKTDFCLSDEFHKYTIRAYMYIDEKWKKIFTVNCDNIMRFKNDICAFFKGDIVLFLYIQADDELIGSEYISKN